MYVNCTILSLQNMNIPMGQHPKKWIQSLIDERIYVAGNASVIPKSLYYLTTCMYTNIHAMHITQVFTRTHVYSYIHSYFYLHTDMLCYIHTHAQHLCIHIFFSTHLHSFLHKNIHKNIRTCIQTKMYR